MGPTERIKWLLAGIVICLLVAVVAGCGDEGDETTRNPKRELLHWYAGVQASVAKMERIQKGFTKFQVGVPPAKSDLAELSPAGVKAGEKAGDAADQLDAATALTGEEAAGLYCYFFAFYVSSYGSPGKEEIEIVIFNLVKSRMLPSASAAEVHESANALRESMIQAERTKGLGPKVAAGILC